MHIMMMHTRLGATPDPLADRANMLQKFEQTMRKMSLLGFDESTLTDCSDVIPTPSGTVADPFIPAGLAMSDIEAACASTPFPTLSAVPGMSTLYRYRTGELTGPGVPFYRSYHDHPRCVSDSFFRFHARCMLIMIISAL